MIYQILKLSAIKSKHYINNIIRSKKPSKVQNYEIKKILNCLKNDGIYIYENFYEKSKCRQMIDEFNQALIKFKKIVKGDQYGCDKRIFGAQNISQDFFNYYNNSFINNIAEQYLNSKVANISSMANKVEYKIGNLGSGNGTWHRDNINKQFKTILYLSDVEKNGGGFQFVRKSHLFNNIIKIYNFMNKNILLTDFSDLDVQKFCKETSLEIETAEFPAGTLIIVDTSILHRGSPIKSGSLPRYALTNYIYEDYLKDCLSDHHLDKSLENDLLNY